MNTNASYNIHSKLFLNFSLQSCALQMYSLGQTILY